MDLPTASIPFTQFHSSADTLAPFSILKSQKENIGGKPIGESYHEGLNGKAGATAKKPYETTVAGNAFNLIFKSA